MVNNVLFTEVGIGLKEACRKRRAGVYCVHFNSVFEQKDGHREILTETTLFLLYQIHQIIFLQESQFQSYLLREWKHLLLFPMSRCSPWFPKLHLST